MSWCDIKFSWYFNRGSEKKSSATKQYEVKKYFSTSALSWDFYMQIYFILSPKGEYNYCSVSEIIWLQSFLFVSFLFFFSQIALIRHWWFTEHSLRGKTKLGASLVAQWLRICLPMQGTRVRALVWEDPACRGATKPVSHNYWACASGPCAPQREGPR